MKKKLLYYIIVALFSIFGTYFLYQLYYYHSRNVVFDLVLDIQKPYESFDYSFYKGCDYIASDRELMHRLVYWLGENKFQNYDSVYVEQLNKKLDFEKYDYVITYHKELLELNHSMRGKLKSTVYEFINY